MSHGGKSPREAPRRHRRASVRGTFFQRGTAFSLLRALSIESRYRPRGGRSTRLDRTGMIGERIASLIPRGRWTPRCSTSRNTTISIRIEASARNENRWWIYKKRPARRPRFTFQEPLPRKGFFHSSRTRRVDVIFKRDAVRQYRLIPRPGMPARVWFTWIAIIPRREPSSYERQVSNICPLTPYWYLIDRWLLSIKFFCLYFFLQLINSHDCAFYSSDCDLYFLSVSIIYICIFIFMSVFISVLFWNMKKKDSKYVIQDQSMNHLILKFILKSDLFRW